MQLGMIGLGRMGGNLVRRLRKGGHACVVYDVDAAAMQALQGPGIEPAESPAVLASKLGRPRVVWVMLPSGVTGKVIEELSPSLAAGDTIIDGGNGCYLDDLPRAQGLKASGIHYVDCGTSGGVSGLERGFCLMIGGEDDVVRRLDPIFKSLAPGVEAAARTPDAGGGRAQAERGYLHCGGSGAGHYMKMVHNGIEYGLMAAYAEGFNILKNAPAGLRLVDAAQAAELWRRGSVISSRLLDLTAQSLALDSELAEFSDRVSDSGEGRWLVAAAIEEGVPAPVISAALFSRLESQGRADFANRVQSAMRKQFGGHQEIKKEGK